MLTNFLVHRATKDNSYMPKFIEKIISTKLTTYIQRGEGKYVTPKFTTVEKRFKAAEYIGMFLVSLKNSGEHNDFSEYQNDCINRIDQMKNIIRNCYQSNSFYKKFAECVLSYLSIVEVNILLESFNLNRWNSWKDELENYAYWTLVITIDCEWNYNPNYKPLTPEEWINQIRAKNLKSNEWCNTLLEDLLFLERHYKTYKFDRTGWIYT